MDDTSSKLPVTIDFTDGSLFAPILKEFDSEVTLYDQIMSQVDPEVFDRLETKKKGSIAGMAFIDGGIFEEKLSLAGRASASDDIFTKKLSVAGSSTFNGMLGVGGKASFAGRTRVKENALFGGKASIAGSATFDQNVVASGSLSVAGKVTIAEYLLADSPVGISGTLSTESIRCDDALTLSGKVFVDSDIIAKEVITDGITGMIEGNLYAQTIRDVYVPEKKAKNLATIGGIFTYVKDTLFGIFSRRNRGLLIGGDVIADEVDLNNMTVRGNVYAKDVIVGEKTEIAGTIHYLNTIKLPEGAEFKIQKGFPDKLNPSNTDMEK